MISTRKSALLASAATAAAALTAQAGEWSKAPDPKLPIVEEKTFCDYWTIPPLYQDEGNPFLQEISFGGRYQGQYYLLDSDQCRSIP